jgi:prepilin-type processing-associated H-X9-DG protein
VPPHKRSGSALPAGGNQVFADGSVRWVSAQKMYFFHSWAPGWTGGRVAYFYQDSQDFDGRLGLPATLNSIRFRP